MEKRWRLGLLLLVFWCGCQTPWVPLPLVGIILWNQDIQSFEENLQGVTEGLREEGLQADLNLRLRVVNATGDRAQVAAAVRDFEKEGARLLITLGTVPTLIALEATWESRLAVVYSGVGAPAETGLQWPGEQGEPRFTGTSMEVPVVEQLARFRLAKPSLERLGILYCTATPVAVATGARAEAAAQAMGLKVIKATIPDERRELLEKALADLMDQKVEGLFLPTDPVLASPGNLRIILERTGRVRVPVMVPFESSVRLGALLAYHADFVEVGRQAGRQAARILRGSRPGSVTPEGPKVKRLTLNVRVARELDLPLSRHLLSRAHDLY